MASKRIEILRAELRTTFFEPRKWRFWRALIVAFCLCSMLGHAFEVPYCATMNALFGIIEDDYAVLSDPWFVPYFVYGFGAVAMTLILEPIKELILRRSRTIVGALLKMFILTILVAAFFETLFGFIVNQPDATGKYPYWDNARLPLNILGQGWLVNDFFIGIAAMGYLWVIFPAISLGLRSLGERRANIAFAIIVAFFLVCCGLTIYHFYLPNWLTALGLR